MHKQAGSDTINERILFPFIKIIFATVKSFGVQSFHHFLQVFLIISIKKWSYFVNSLFPSRISLHKEWSFPLRISYLKVTFAEKFLTWELRFLCSVWILFWNSLSKMTFALKGLLYGQLKLRNLSLLRFAWVVLKENIQGSESKVSKKSVKDKGYNSVLK